MVITVLGTAAAEGWPALWCVCDACREAAVLGGRNIRKRTAYNIDNRVQVDFGPDAYRQMAEHGLDYSQLEHLLITHSHADHLQPTDLAYRRPGFAVIPEGSWLVAYGNVYAEARVREAIPDLSRCSMEWRPIEPFRPVDLGDGLVATPLPAEHAGGEEAVNYLLQQDGRGALLGTDTGWWPPETWEYLSGCRLEVVLLDCTYGPSEYSGGHLNCASVVRAKAELQKLGAAADGWRFIATHFSHNGGALHEELEEILGPEGVEVAYDGMLIEV